MATSVLGTVPPPGKMRFARLFVMCLGPPLPSPHSHPLHCSHSEFLGLFLAVPSAWNPRPLFSHLFLSCPFLWGGSTRCPPYVPPRCPLRIPSQPLAPTAASASDHGSLSLHAPVPPTPVPVPGLAQGTLSTSVQNDSHRMRHVQELGRLGPCHQAFSAGHTALTHRLLTPNTCCQRLSRI